MNLGILLTTGMESENLHTARKLAEAALAEGHEVSLFLMDEAVYIQDRLLSLTEMGAQVVICGHNSQERALPRVEKVLFGSQYDWAEIVHNADRVIALG